MCWVTKNKKFIKKRIAKEDIFVKKLMSKSMDTKFVESPCFNMVWEFGRCEKYREKIAILKAWDLEALDLDKKLAYVIQPGFHSLSPTCNVEKINQNAVAFYESKKVFSYFDYNNSFILVDAKIPKGSIYYENEQGEIVSNKLIILQEREFDV